MGTSKTNLFSDCQNQVAKIGKALAHPARIAILEYLIRVNACVCGEIVDELPLSQSTVSQHLKVLKECNMIKGNISGKSICYCINTDQWKAASIVLAQFLNQEVSKKC